MNTATTPSLALQLLKPTFAIHSLAANSAIPAEALSAPIFFLAKTHGEVSIVLPEDIAIESEDVERDWRALEVVGPLDFSLTGILSRISSILANENISIFAISTFDTDYILVKQNNIDNAINALSANQYKITRD